MNRKDHQEIAKLHFNPMHPWKSNGFWTLWNPENHLSSKPPWLFWVPNVNFPGCTKKRLHQRIPASSTSRPNHPGPRPAQSVDPFRSTLVRDGFFFVSKLCVLSKSWKKIRSNKKKSFKKKTRGENLPTFQNITWKKKKKHVKNHHFGPLSEVKKVTNPRGGH